MATKVQKTSLWNQFNRSDCLLSIELFVVKQTRQTLRLIFKITVPTFVQNIWAIKIPMSDQNTNEQSKYQQMLSYKVHNTNGQKYQQKKWSKYHFVGIMIIGILNVGILILTRFFRFSRVADWTSRQRDNITTRKKG